MTSDQWLDSVVKQNFKKIIILTLNNLVFTLKQVLTVSSQKSYFFINLLFFVTCTQNTLAYAHSIK